MARNIRAKTRRLGIMLLTSIAFLSACTNHNRKDFVGEWRSEIGNSYIYFYEDGTTNGRLEPEVFFDEWIDTSKLQSGYISQREFDQIKNDTIIFDRESSKWNYKKEESTGRWEIGIWSNYAKPRSLNTNFHISGSGVFKTSAPFTIFRYKGDPDEYNLFKFKKK